MSDELYLDNPVQCYLDETRSLIASIRKSSEEYFSILRILSMTKDNSHMMGYEPVYKLYKALEDVYKALCDDKLSFTKNLKTLINLVLDKLSFFCELIESGNIDDMAHENLVSFMQDDTFLINHQDFHGFFVTANDSKYMIPSDYIYDVICESPLNYEVVQNQKVTNYVIESETGIKEDAEIEQIPVYSLSSLFPDQKAKSLNVLDTILIVDYQTQRIGIIVDSVQKFVSVIKKNMPPAFKKFKTVTGLVFDEKYDMIPILNIPEIMRRFRSLRGYDVKKFEAITKKHINKILIVDDSCTTRQIEHTILSANNFNVDEACDGIDAIEKMKHKQFDLILCDDAMPRMDGKIFLDNVRPLLKKKFYKSGYTPYFESDGIKLLMSAYETQPDAILLNAKGVNPKTSVLVRFLKSIDVLKKIPVAVYATSDFSFENAYMTNTGADIFIHMETDSIPDRLNDLIALSKNNQLSAGPLENDIMKTGIAERIFSYMKELDNLEALVASFLNLLTEFCEIPAASLYLSEEDGTKIFYICASNFTDAEINDFLKVCTSEFEQVLPDTNVLLVTGKRLKNEYPIDKYHSSDIPLSAFQSLKLISANGDALGTVNMVREGAFTTHQLDLLEFCTNLFNSLIENAISLKKKRLYQFMQSIKIAKNFLNLTEITIQKGLNFTKKEPGGLLTNILKKQLLNYRMIRLQDLC